MKIHQGRCLKWIWKISQRLSWKQVFLQKKLLIWAQERRRYELHQIVNNPWSRQPKKENYSFPNLTQDLAIFCRINFCKKKIKFFSFIIDPEIPLSVIGLGQKLHYSSVAINKMFFLPQHIVQFSCISQISTLYIRTHLIH